MLPHISLLRARHSLDLQSLEAATSACSVFPAGIKYSVIKHSDTSGLFLKWAARSRLLEHFLWSWSSPSCCKVKAHPSWRSERPGTPVRAGWQALVGDVFYSQPASPHPLPSHQSASDHSDSSRDEIKDTEGDTVTNNKTTRTW